MASEAYKRVKQRQLQRRKQEKIIKFTVFLVIAVIIVTAAVLMEAFRAGRTGDSGDNVQMQAATQDNENTQAQPDLADGKNSDKNNSDEENTSGDEGELTAPLEVDVQPQNEKFEMVQYPQKSDSYVEIRSKEILSPYVILMDVNSNQILAGRKYQEKIYPASMTKVMTLIVAVDELKDFDQTFTMTAEIIDSLYQQEASMAGFAPEEQVTAKDLLYGVILPSGADACVGIANLVAGSEENFVKLMNQKCEEMGLVNTHFVNTSGLYDENHYTTTEDMAMIMQYAMSNPTCKEILSTYQYSTQSTPQHPEGILLTSTMFSRMYGTEVEGVQIIAGKTGYTDEAGSCLVSYAEREDDRYIAVTAKAAGKWNAVFDDFRLYGNYIPNPPGYVRS